MVNTKDFVCLEQARAVVFNRLTALLCQPEDDLLNNTELFDTLKQALDIAYPDGSAYVEQMQETAKQSTAQALLIEYTRLFIGPFKTLVPPYSSLYFGSETLMSDETVWVMNCYKKSGLEFDTQLNDVPDHIAVETEFMYYLIHSEISALEAEKRDEALALWENQQEFFDRHYRKWLPQFCAKLATETRSEYYKTLSECLNRFVKNVDVPAFPN
jgi:putative dimethyl sulfoxide reductase chaperone